MTILRPGEEVEQVHLMDPSNALREIIMLVALTVCNFTMDIKVGSAHPVPVSNSQTSHLPVRFVYSHSKSYYEAAILRGKN